MQKKKVFILSWPAGVGKNTLWALVKPLCENTIEESISMTTRKPIRVWEQDGVDYYFVDRDFFEQKIREDAFLEYAITHTFYYGSPSSELDRIITKNRSPIYIIDVKWMQDLKVHLENKWYEVTTIFLLPPSIDEMRKRLRNRGTESEEQYEIRLATAMEEFKQQDLYDIHIVNDDLEKAKEELLQVLQI